MNRSIDRNKIDGFILESMLDGLPQCICWLQESGKVLYINAAFVEMLKYSERDIYELEVFQMCPSLNRSQWSKQVRDLFTHRSSFARLQFQPKNGLLKSYTVQLTKIIADHHILIGLVLIDDKDAMPHPLIGHLSKQSQIAAWSWKSKQEHLRVTPLFNELLGLTAQGAILPLAILQDVLKTHLNAEDRITAIRQLHTLQIENKSVELSVTLQSSNTKITINAHAEVSNKKLIGAYGTIHKTEEEREDSATTLDFSNSNLLDYFPQMLLIMEEDGRIINANEAVVNSTAYSVAELEEMSIEQLIPELEYVIDWKTLGDNEKRYANLSCHPKSNSPFSIQLQLQSFFENDKRYFSIVLEESNSLMAEVERLKSKLVKENSLLRNGLESGLNPIISQSLEYQNILRQLRQVASTDATVLILGETGTGKELLARAVHRESNRKEFPLVKINCAALPENLIESELFGHEKGAFTGASDQKIGRFELADKGTIFLDEIGELPLDLQPKLLRVLQEGEFERLGNSQTFKVDVRVVAATNRNLVKLIQAGKFREDLYYRLNVFPIENMPLRDRKDDIPLLAEFFVKKYRDKIGKSVKGIQAKAMKKLMKYDFPGNIRELENIIERAIILTKGEKLSLDHWQPEPNKVSRKSEPLISFEEVQKQHIIKALKKTKWRVSGPYGAAKLLQMNAKTLESKMRKYGLIRKDYFRK